MAAIPGSKKIIALGLASTFGTPKALGAGHRIEVESYSDSENTSELTSNSIGSGKVMTTESERGQASPTVDIEMNAGYNDASLEAVSQFFGSASVTSIANGYTHTFTVQENFNLNWLTVADLKTTTKSAEYPSCSVTSLTYNISTNEYLRLAIGLLGNLQELDSSVNTASTLASTTVANKTRVVVRPENLFRINLQGGGALGSGNNMAITNAAIEFLKPQEHIAEVRGLPGNGEPESAEGLPLQAMLSITRKSQSSLEFMEAHQAGTEYKASIIIEGAIIGGSTRYTYEFNFPRLKVIDPVDAPATSASRNPETINFKALVAASNPTGMTSVYPYVRVINNRATAYLP